MARRLHRYAYMNQLAEALKERAMRFAVRIVRFCRTLPDTGKVATSRINCSEVALVSRPTTTPRAAPDRGATSYQKWE